MVDILDFLFVKDKYFKAPPTHGGLTADGVLLQLVLLDAVVGPLGEGGDAAHWVGVGGRGVQVEVEGAQQGGGRLAARRGGAAVGDGGVGPLEGGTVLERRHCNGRPHSRLCEREKQNHSNIPNDFVYFNELNEKLRERLTCPLHDVIYSSVTDSCFTRLDVHERFASDPHRHHLLHTQL